MNVHLNDTRIAAVASEQPSAAEALHLESCGTCRRKVEEQAKLIAGFAALADLPAPARLRSSVLSRAGGGQALRVPRPRWWPRAVAAATLFAAGALSGVVVARSNAQVAPSSPVPIPATPEWLTTSDGNPAARLALLTAIELTTNAALVDAPDDPGIRMFHDRVSAERRAAAAATLGGSLRWF